MINQELLIPTQIIKSKRKTISLIVKSNGDFIVRAPMRVKDHEINQFIEKKAEWIITKRLEHLKNHPKSLDFSCNPTINILGKPYVVMLNENVKMVKIIDGLICLPIKNPQLYLVAYLKKLAKQYIHDRVELVCSLFNFKHGKISISSAKTCWGSCSANDNLHFTYKLMMCPEDVVDYIVVHELCHTLVKNHSKKFWDLVERCCPNYKSHEKWLKRNRGIVETI